EAAPVRYRDIAPIAYAHAADRFPPLVQNPPFISHFLSLFFFRRPFGFLSLFFKPHPRLISCRQRQSAFHSLRAGNRHFITVLFLLPAGPDSSSRQLIPGRRVRQARNKV